MGWKKVLYQKRPEFVEPDFPESVVWHYRPFDYFKSILDEQSLFFSTIKRLQELENFEGTFPRANHEAYMRAVRVSISEQGLSQDESEQIVSATSQLYEGFTGQSSAMLPYMVANCWHVNESESLRMWENYGDVAIKTTFKRLTQSFDNTTKKLYYANGNEIPVHAGMMRYIDRNKQLIPYAPFSWHIILQKDIESFSHEKELRIAVDLSPSHFDLPIHYSSQDTRYYPENRIPQLLRDLVKMEGVFIPVDLDTLIETVVISPFAKPDIESKIEYLLKNRGLVNVELCNSKK